MCPGGEVSQADLSKMGTYDDASKWGPEMLYQNVTERWVAERRQHSDKYKWGTTYSEGRLEGPAKWWRLWCLGA